MSAAKLVGALLTNRQHVRVLYTFAVHELPASIQAQLHFLQPSASRSTQTRADKGLFSGWRHTVPDLSCFPAIEHAAIGKARTLTFYNSTVPSSADCCHSLESLLHNVELGI